MSRPEPATDPSPEVWPDRAAHFYARTLDRSDYGAAIAGVLSGAAPASLLDIGAGAGHPVASWLPASSVWTALEPNRYLRARLGRLGRAEARPLRALNATWQALPQLAPPRHDWSWAANIGATLTHPRALLAMMRGLARERVVWLVPAQRGPRRWCLAGALPAALHGESETPGLERVLEALGAAQAPDAVLHASWSFRAAFASLEAGIDHCAERLALAPDARCRSAIAEHLAATATPLPGGGVELVAPKHSALLIWDL